MHPRHILQLVGSPTDTFHCELSQMYAQGCANALSGIASHRFSYAHISPDGAWCFPESLSLNDRLAAQKYETAEALAIIASMGVDCGLPQLFCLRGMTECRAIFRILDIPFIGNNPLQMDLSANKVLARNIVSASGVNVPKGEVITNALCLSEHRSTVSYPVVVKPIGSDNSHGVSFVKGPAQLSNAIAEARLYHEQVLIEKYIELGREVRCGIIQRNEGLVCLPLEEYAVDADKRPIRLHSDKLVRDPDQQLLELPAASLDLSWIVDQEDPLTQIVQTAALKCYSALGCRHYGLFDFRVDPSGVAWFLEAGLYCSFSPRSVIVKMCEAHGISLENYFAESVQLAIDGG
ncbi:MAG: ATP-grasp domain-containing protein [Pseudomonadota bacterium]|nr:ATP-grasp domain-containing protein [Pseudomonadota bacterium]